MHNLNKDTFKAQGLSAHSPTQRGKRVWYIRKTVLRYSRQNFARKHSIPAPSLQNWETGKYGGLTEKGAQKLIHAFEVDGIVCSLEWLLYEIGNPPVSTRADIPILNELLQQQKSSFTQELQLFHQLNPNAADTIIPDDSMEPCFPKGSLVAGTRVFAPDLARALGENCIIQLTNGEILVRQLLPAKSNHYKLHSLRPKPRLKPTLLPTPSIFSAAPIIWWRKIPQ